MATLAVQVSSAGGLAPTYAAASAGGDDFPNTGREFLHVKNGSAASINATINSAQLCNYGFDHDVVVAVPAGGERIIGPFVPSRFGLSVGVTYSAVTSVTVAAVQV